MLYCKWGDAMKKVIRILLLLAMLILIANYVTSCPYMYSDDHIVDNLCYIENDVLPICFVSDYSWNTNEREAVVNILDECAGKTVTALGGHAQCPFLVNLEYSRYGCAEELLPENAVIEQYHMVLNLGKNIREAEYIEMDHYHCVGTNRFVQILVTVNCPEENRWFHSENGKLYRKDGSLVTGFFYASDYAES